MRRPHDRRVASLIVGIVVCISMFTLFPSSIQMVHAVSPEMPEVQAAQRAASPIVVFDEWTVEDSDHIHAVIRLSRFNPGDNVTLAYFFYDTELSFSCSSGLTLLQYDEINMKALFSVSGTDGGPNGSYSFDISGTNIDTRVPRLQGAIPTTPVAPTNTPTPTPTMTPTATPTCTPTPKETNTPTPVSANTLTPKPINTTMPAESTVATTTVAAPVAVPSNETTNVEASASADDTTVPATSAAATAAASQKMTEEVQTQEETIGSETTVEPAEYTSAPSDDEAVAPMESTQGDIVEETQPPTESETNVAQSIVMAGTAEPKYTNDEIIDYSRLVWGLIVLVLIVVGYIRYRKLEKEDRGLKYILVNFIPVAPLLEKIHGKQTHVSSEESTNVGVKNGCVQKSTAVSAAAAYRPIKSTVSETSIQRKINEKKVSSPNVNTASASEKSTTSVKNDVEDILPEMMRSQEELERSMEELSKEMEQLKNFKE